MNLFLITQFTKNISIVNLFGILLGHIIFGFALTKILDWSWLKNLMSDADKEKMLKSYIWKDLLADSAIIAIFVGILLLISSIFL